MHVHRAVLKKKKSFTEVKCNKRLESGVQGERSKAVELLLLHVYTAEENCYIGTIELTKSEK